MRRNLAIVTLLVIAALWPLSYIFSTSVSFPLPPQRFAVIDLTAGRFHLSISTRQHFHRTAATMTTTADIARRVEQARSYGIGMEHPGRMFRLQRIDFTLPNGSRWRGFMLTFGWWVVVVTAALLFVIDLRRRRIPPHLCKACRYDLSGATHERCPECGEDLACATSTPASTRT